MESEFSRLPSRLALGAGFSAPVVAIALLVWWSVKRQWQRVLVWLGATIVVSLIAAGVLLSSALRASPLTGEQHYAWTGWYLIWFIGAFFTSQIMIIVLPVKYLIGAAWKRWRGKPKGASAPQPETMAASVPAKAAKS